MGFSFVGRMTNGWLRRTDVNCKTHPCKTRKDGPPAVSQNPLIFLHRSPQRLAK